MPVSRTQLLLLLIIQLSSTLTANIRKRRGEKVQILVPVYHDVHTPTPFVDPTVPPSLSVPSDMIYMDAMCFGMGCSCLQITLQARTMKQARHLYDHLAVICPLVMALTASSPVFRGYLADVDVRWNVIAASVDDRTREERGLEVRHSRCYK